MPKSDTPHIEVKHLDMAYGKFAVINDLNFTVKHHEVFVVMGPSGCGKSTLLKYLIGLLIPKNGDILYHGKSFTKAYSISKENMIKKFGVLYQGGALWSSMTLLENVSLPLELYTDLSSNEIAELASVKLALVGLHGFESFYPAQLSGGMRKRAGLARAMALDPEILFFDEPSSGLDPVSSKNMDNLILALRDSIGSTIVVVSHELSSIFTIADNAIYLDPISKTMTAEGNPNDILKTSKEKNVIDFLTRGELQESRDGNAV